MFFDEAYDFGADIDPDIPNYFELYEGYMDDEVAYFDT